MAVDAQSTVRDVVVEIPRATRLFEKLGIDYCCGGGKSLQEAGLHAGLSVEEIIRSLDELKQSPPAAQAEMDWQGASLSQLISHIVNQHHQFTRDELSRLTGLLTKVCGVHGTNHPELLEIKEVFSPMNEELMDHMHKEEQILFPYMVTIEQSVERKQALAPPFFRSVLNPIEMMMTEHESAGQSLAEIRRLSHEYEVPGDGCGSFRALYQGLGELEKDLHQHIHLENNILFPKSVRMESTAFAG